MRQIMLKSIDAITYAIVIIFVLVLLWGMVTPAITLTQGRTLQTVCILFCYVPLILSMAWLRSRNAKIATHFPTVSEKRKYFALLLVIAFIALFIIPTINRLIFHVYPDAPKKYHGSLTFLATEVAAMAT